MKLVPIIWRVLGKRFGPALQFFFGWQSRLPVMIITRKQLHNFAHDMCDHAVYETSQAYESRITAATNQAYDSLLAALEKQNVEAQMSDSKPANVKPRVFEMLEEPSGEYIDVVSKDYADQLERELAEAKELNRNDTRRLLENRDEINKLRAQSTLEVDNWKRISHSMSEELAELTARAEKAESEYANLCKFANDYEARAEKAEADLAVTLKRYQQKERANKERARRLLID